MHVYQPVLRRQSQLVRLSRLAKPAVQPSAARRTRPSVEAMLHEIAYVLHCTRKIKAMPSVAGQGGCGS